MLVKTVLRSLILNTNELDLQTSLLWFTPALNMMLCWLAQVSLEPADVYQAGLGSGWHVIQARLAFTLARLRWLSINVGWMKAPPCWMAYYSTAGRKGRECWCGRQGDYRCSAVSQSDGLDLNFAMLDYCSLTFLIVKDVSI